MLLGHGFIRTATKEAFLVYCIQTVSIATTVVFPSSLLVEFWEGIMKAGYSALIVVNVKKCYSFIYKSF